MKKDPKPRVYVVCTPKPSIIKLTHAVSVPMVFVSDMIGLGLGVFPLIGISSHRYGRSVSK